MCVYLLLQSTLCLLQNLILILQPLDISLELGDLRLHRGRGVGGGGGGGRMKSKHGGNSTLLMSFPSSLLTIAATVIALHPLPHTTDTILQIVRPLWCTLRLYTNSNWQTTLLHATTHTAQASTQTSGHSKGNGMCFWTNWQVPSNALWLIWELNRESLFTVHNSTEHAKRHSHSQRQQ